MIELKGFVGKRVNPDRVQIWQGNTCGIGGDAGCGFAGAVPFSKDESGLSILLEKMTKETLTEPLSKEEACYASKVVLPLRIYVPIRAREPVKRVHLQGSIS